MSSSDVKSDIQMALAEVAQAFGHVHRLKIIDALAQRARSVEELAKFCNLSIANTSQHLQIMRRARVVDASRQGKNNIYRLNGHDDVVALMSALSVLGERNRAEVSSLLRTYFADRDALEPLSRGDLLDRLADGSATVIDVRPADEFFAGHLPGALNIPIEQLADRLEELPTGVEVVAYCRGPYCIMSFDAVALLRAHGFGARRLEEGYPEWKAAGLAVTDDPERFRS